MATIKDQYWLKDGLSTRMDEDGIITHNESTIIEFNEVVENGPDAIASSGFQQGQEHRDNFNLNLNGSINAEVISEGNGAVWRFDLEYSTSGTNLSNTFGGNEQRAKVEIGTWTYSQVVESDKEDGSPIVNTAGDPFDPAPEEIIASPVLRITLRQSSANVKRVEDVGSINQSQVKIAGISFPPYCAMLAAYDVEASRDERGYLTFFNTYTIKGCFKKSNEGDLIGFQMELLNQGFNQLKDGKKQGITILEPKDPKADPVKFTDVPVATPQLLDENGEVGSTAHYSLFIVHNTADFSRFRLPSSYPVN